MMYQCAFWSLFTDTFNAVSLRSVTTTRRDCDLLRLALDARKSCRRSVPVASQLQPRIYLTSVGVTAFTLPYSKGQSFYHPPSTRPQVGPMRIPAVILTLLSNAQKLQTRRLLAINVMSSSSVIFLLISRRSAKCGICQASNAASGRSVGVTFSMDSDRESVSEIMSTKLRTARVTRGVRRPQFSIRCPPLSIID